MSVLLWWYASNKHRLIEADVEPHTIRYVFYRSVATIVMALIVAGIAFLNTLVAFVILGLYAILAIVFGRLYTVVANTSRKPRRRT